MRKIMILATLVCFGVICTVGLFPPSSDAKTRFATIGTGGITGVYYPTGGAISKMINKKRKIYGVRCTVESTAGSVFNVNAVLSGDLDFGIVQSDRQYQAVNGKAEWKDAGPQKELRAIFSIHPEAVTLVAAQDAGIKSINDLRANGSTSEIPVPDDAAERH